MTPQEFVKIRDEQNEIIDTARTIIYEAHKEADKCELPKNVRPANANDIKVDAIIWYKRAEEDGGDFWNIVDQPLNYGDDFKAYMSEGSRYGLNGAYVQKETSSDGS